MKKKILIGALVVALVALMISGSLAYFTANDEVTNTFTIGSVLIDIWENGQPTETDEVIFTEPLVPVVNTQDLTNDPGYNPKEIKVMNTGENAAFIRTHIAVPKNLVGYLELHIEKTGWTELTATEATVDGVTYTVYTFDHNEAVAPDYFTNELLQGAYLGSTVDIKDNPADAAADLEFCKPDGNGGYTFSNFVAHTKTATGYTSSTVKILVASQAIQAQGFESSTATEALNAGFGANTNPWQ